MARLFGFSGAALYCPAAPTMLVTPMHLPILGIKTCYLFPRPPAPTARLILAIGTGRVVQLFCTMSLLLAAPTETPPQPAAATHNARCFL